MSAVYLPHFTFSISNSHIQIHSQMVFKVKYSIAVNSVAFLSYKIQHITAFICFYGVVIDRENGSWPNCGS